MLPYQYRFLDIYYIAHYIVQRKRWDLFHRWFFRISSDDSDITSSINIYGGDGGFKGLRGDLIDPIFGSLNSARDGIDGKNAEKYCPRRLKGLILSRESKSITTNMRLWESAYNFNRTYDTDEN